MRPRGSSTDGANDKAAAKMHTDALMISEAPEPIKKPPILGHLLGMHKFGGISSEGRPEANLTRPSGAQERRESDSPPQAMDQPQNHVTATGWEQGLDSSDQAIRPPAAAEVAPLPLPAEVTPHIQQHQQQLPAHIKPGPSRDARGGVHEQSLTPDNSVTPNMIFSDLYKSPRSPLSKLRNSLPHAVPLPPDFDADLVSKDKNRQKEAVRKYLANKVRNDWAFVWPPVVSSPLSTPPDENTIMTAPEPAPQDGSQIATENTESNINSAPPANDEDAIARDPGEEADSQSDAESVYSTVSEDPAHFRARAEWTSDLSDDDEPIPGAHSPYRFDSPDAVGTVVQSTMMARRKRRRKAIREESKWNPGLACFEARRDAWTGAKTVRVKPKPPSPVSPPASPRRLQIWRHRRTSSTPAYAAVVTGALPPHNDVAAITPPPSEPETATHNTKGSTSTVEEEEGTSSKASEPRVLYPVETLLPLPPPLLPPQNPMRASVTPSIYPSLYDKIVVNNLQPSCPVNLSDMLRACVAGWKRDGEWPPRPAVAPMPTASELAAMRHHQRRSNAAIGTATASASRVAAAQQRQQQHARNGSTATNGSTTRRMSFVGFLSGNKDKEKDKTENKTTEGEPLEKVKTAKDGSNSEEGSGGKSSIRRSLQKVFSLGSHGSHHGNQPASPPAVDGTAPAAAG